MKKIPNIILLFQPSRSSDRELLRGLARYTRLHGPWVFYRREPFSYRHSHKSRPCLPISLLKKLDIAGIITCEPENCKEIVMMGLPTVLFDSSEKSYPKFIKFFTDADMIGKMAAEHLLNCGFRHFAFCGFKEMHWSYKRAESFRKWIAAAGYETHFYEQPKSRIKCLWENEQNIIADWLKSLPKPLGLMACNDDRGEQVSEACKIAEIDVPEQIAIIGVDNDELVCNLSTPPLSSIALNTEKAGYEAARLLHKLIDGEKIEVENRETLIQATHIVTRQSTDVLAIEDQEVVKALRFIRRHYKEVAGVSDVMEVMTLSRRTLERRFKEILGRSIHSEIKRCRVEQITRMLVETDMSISQIAIELGYLDVNNITRYFQQEKGITPSVYRKQYRHSSE